MEEQIVDEWPDVIVESEQHEEYSRLNEAVGELTSAILDCKHKGLMTPSLANDISNFLSAALLVVDGGT